MYVSFAWPLNRGRPNDSEIMIATRQKQRDTTDSLNRSCRVPFIHHAPVDAATSCVNTRKTGRGIMLPLFALSLGVSVAEQDPDYRQPAN